MTLVPQRLRLSRSLTQPVVALPSVQSTQGTHVDVPEIVEVSQ
jgi:hypothetical protein